MLGTDSWSASKRMLFGTLPGISSRSPTLLLTFTHKRYHTVDVSDESASGRSRHPLLTCQTKVSLEGLVIHIKHQPIADITGRTTVPSADTFLFSTVRDP